MRNSIWKRSRSAGFALRQMPPQNSARGALQVHVTGYDLSHQIANLGRVIAQRIAMLDDVGSELVGRLLDERLRPRRNRVIADARPGKG